MAGLQSAPQEGQRLGDFLVSRQIGRGGMGVVYEAVQVSLHRRVALKVLCGVALTPRAVERFRREAEAAAKLHHTNVVPVYAIGEEDGIHFYAMELVEGPSLDQVIRQHRRPASPTPPADVTPHPLAATGPYAEAQAASPSASGLRGSGPSSGSAYFDAAAAAIAGVAEALEYAHREGVIHRDVKPSNLLVSPAGRLSLSDFGLARMLEQPGMTITGEMVGTPMYMSPEQITAGRIPVDHRTDVYSLGATLYELLTLAPPFRGEQRDQLLAQIIQKEPQPPRKVNPKVPVDLETICLKAMDKDPDRRYQTAGQMAEDLRRYVNRFAILARRTGPLGRARKWVARNPALSTALAAVLVVCVGAAGGLAYQWHLGKVRQEESQARHAAALLDKERRGALDTAILLAKVGDFDGAQEAIREAVKLGCSEGQLLLLRGQLELYQGNVKVAIEHLEGAVELLPESVSARSMLAWAYFNSGRITEYYRTLGEARALQPGTPEDNLFLGQAEAIDDADAALRRVNEAIGPRPSLLARLVRLDVLRSHVLDAPDLDNARTLLRDAEAVKGRFPDNAIVLGLSASAHATCFHVFGELNQPELRDTALARGLKDCEALQQFGPSPKALVDRWTFLMEVGRTEAAAAELKRTCAETKDPGLIFNLGIYLYLTGEFEEAAKVLEWGSGEPVFDLLCVLTLAELPGGLARARQLLAKVEARDLAGWDLFNTQLILRVLNDKPRAVQLSRRLLADPKLHPPIAQGRFLAAVKYCAGELRADELTASTGGRRLALSNAHLCIALTALADRDRGTARRHLELCIRTNYFDALPYAVSLMLLSRMRKDTHWPPWIGPKSD